MPPKLSITRLEAGTGNLTGARTKSPSLMLDIPENVLPDVWTAHAHLAPMKPAMRDDRDAITWGEFGERMNRVGHVLRRMGVGKGDRVATLMGNSVAHLVLLCGCMKYGACVAPISTLLAPEQVGALIADSGSRLVFVDDTTASAMTSARTAVAELDRVRIVIDGQHAEWASLPGLLAEAPSDDLCVPLVLDDLVNISYSSGTTGSPKGVLYSHRTRQNMAMTYAIGMQFGQLSRLLVTTPIYSNGTWITLWPALFTGGEVVIQPAFDPEVSLRLIEEERITHAFMVPTQYVRLLACDAIGRRDLSSLRMCLSAGSNMGPELKARVIEALGPCLFELYGFSEGGATIITPDEMQVRPASVGRPNPGFDVRILDEQDQEMPRGEPGEIAFWGGWVMRGYYNNPSATEAVIWRDNRGRTFIRTGDIGRMDEEGYLYIVDRKKDMIISGGFNVFPSDIEAILHAHSGVLEATVLGVPHPVWGETPIGFVIPRGPERGSAEDLLAWANQRLAKTQRLAAIVWRDEFPRNALGKVVKRDLREEWLAASR